MNTKEDGKPMPRAGGPVVFSWAFYLFGMAVTAPTFAFIVQKLVKPDWGKSFFLGWINPSLNLVAVPVFGAILGFVIVAVCNVAYFFSKRSSRQE